MPEINLELILEKILTNWKKYLGCIIGFIVGITIIKYGLLKALIIFAFAYVGFKLGDATFLKKIKYRIINRLKED